MSDFSNPASAARDAGARYVEALLALLGDRDPLAVQRELLAELKRLTGDLPPDVLRRPEAPGKWSIAEVIEHLTDAEAVTAFRLRAIVAEDTPELAAYDQDRWAARLRYGDAPVGEVLEELAAVRRRNLRLYGALTPAECARFGRHPERGEESAARLAQLMAGHDLVHRRQIERIRRAVAGVPD